MCKSIRRLSVLFCFSLFWLAGGIPLQAETMYQISESELTQLETSLNQLKQNNETKQKLLTEQQTQLSAASQELETVKKQLTESKTLNASTQKSLESANQSLNQLEAEAKKKAKVKARQRNLWIGISGGLLIALISK